MPRRRYVQIDGVLHEVTDEYAARPRGLTIVKDIEPFRSTVDGSMITSRSKLREHNKRHNVTFADDYKNQWAKQRKERELHYDTTKSSKADKEDRIESIKHAIEVNR